MTPNLCDECLEEIIETISTNAFNVFEVIKENPAAHRTEIQSKIDLSYALTGNAILELKYSHLIYQTTEKNKTLHHISDNGQRVLEIQNKYELAYKAGISYKKFMEGAKVKELDLSDEDIEMLDVDINGELKELDVDKGIEVLYQSVHS